MIIASNVTKLFGKFKALDDVSVQFNKGQVIALIGPNGSGKTTLIKTILGMVVPDHGFITFDQQNIRHDWNYKSRIGYMPQIGRYPDSMSIGDVFSLMKEIRSRSGFSEDDELFREFQLNTMLHKKIRTLSGGTRQKVSAALAFLFSPDVMILDEPTAGLDPVASEQLKQKIIREKIKGKLILITSHVLSELDELISEIVYLQEGKLLFHQSWESLQDQTGQQRLVKAIAQIIQRK